MGGRLVIWRFGPHATNRPSVIQEAPRQGETARSIAIQCKCMIVKMMYKGGGRKQDARVLIRESLHDMIRKELLPQPAQNGP